MAGLVLREDLKPSDLGRWSRLYREDPRTAQHLDLEEECLERGRRGRERGYLNLSDLEAMARWKGGGPWLVPSIASNERSFVEAVTGASIRTDNEEFRMKSLTLIHGAGWPVASVVAHFIWPDRYPVIDRRALWSLSYEKDPPGYGFELWEEYRGATRELAETSGLSLREVDQALWMFSKENQSSRSTQSSTQSDAPEA